MWPRVCSCQGAVVRRLSQGCHESGQESLNGQWHLVAILWHIWHGSLRLGSSAELVNCPVLFTPKVEKQRMNTPDLMVTLTKNPLETKKVSKKEIRWLQGHHDGCPLRTRLGDREICRVPFQKVTFLAENSKRSWVGNFSAESSPLSCPLASLLMHVEKVCGWRDFSESPLLSPAGAPGPSHD